MTNRRYLLFFLNICIGCVAANGQIVNGDFSQPFGASNFQTLGSPTIVTDNVPGNDSYAALIESTNDSPASDAGPLNAANADGVGNIDSVLDVTLPSTGFVGQDVPTVGEAIYQQFQAGPSNTLSFEYSYATYDSSPLDSVGYVLRGPTGDGVYHVLQYTPEFTQTTPSAYQTVTIDVPPGLDTIAFVAYDTYDDNYDTQLYISDVILTPEPQAWLLLTGGLVGLGVLLRLKNVRYALS